METTLDSIHVETKTMEYAGFWIRVGAYLIDAILLGIVQSIVGTIFGLTFIYPTDNPSTAIFSAMIPYFIFSLAFQWLYFSLMESSAKQGTLGKMAVGVKVTDLNGERISFMNATGRYFAKIISTIILLIGYIMVAFSKKKQGLHDVLANTLVVYR